MAETPSFPQIDPGILTHVVRQDQDDPHLTVDEWTIAPLNAQGIINPRGLFLVKGSGRDTSGRDTSGRDASRTRRNWSLVLKRVKPGETDPQRMDYWKRELMAARSGLLEDLPGPVAAPRFYHVEEDTEGGALWMEHIQPEQTGRWTAEDFLFAARALGRFNGAYLSGRPLPDFPWLARGHARTWVGGNQPPALAAQEEAVRRAFSPDLLARMQALWDERETFFASLERLPQTFSHFDFQRRNLIVRLKNRGVRLDSRAERRDRSGERQVVAVDWSMCGIGPVGADLSSLLGMSANLYELDPADLPALEKPAFEAYLNGLRAAGWQGASEQARLGFCAWLGLYFGLETGWTVMWTKTEEAQAAALSQFGRPPAALAAGWAALGRFALERAAEARELMGF